ncbi:hypothetical protein UUU_03350 (plasmid) [Klebsiella pneumoniae subsp. pneumoniae DSM 30104 = JCM 1662 = NBRC 14940]|nr:hypothetical protein UUU_03350 [Klebsiella pneumoniae subsp. pneumoniae DSM 30104 = JCM 1662 = NBRC 14940]
MPNLIVLILISLQDTRKAASPPLRPERKSFLLLSLLLL